MGIMEIVKKGFVQASKLMTLILIFFVFNVIIGIISLPLTDPANAGKPAIVAISVISSVLFFLVFVFLQGGAMGLVRDQLKTGSSGIAQFVNYGKTFYLRILGLLLIYFLIAIGVVLLLALASAGILLMGDNIATRSIVAVIITVVALGIITLLLYPVYSIVVEDMGPVMALRKGVMVSKSNFFRTLGLFIVLLVISLIISLIIGFIAGLVTIPLGEGVTRVILAIVNAAVQSYIPIVMMIAFMAFYMSLIHEKNQ